MQEELNEERCAHRRLFDTREPFGPGHDEREHHQADGHRDGEGVKPHVKGPAEGDREAQEPRKAGAPRDSLGQPADRERERQDDDQLAEAKRVRKREDRRDGTVEDREPTAAQSVADGELARTCEAVSACL